MDIFKTFATDPKKELDGVRRQLDESTVLILARFGNDRASRLHIELSHRHREALASADPTIVADTNRAILIETMANHVLIGWEGIEFKGVPLEWTPENAKTLLQINDFRNLVFNLSQNIENFRYDEEAALEKN